jgi:hypothetical protein
MRRVSDSAASPADSPKSVNWRVAFPMSGQGRHAGVVISEVNTWPACTPVSATPAMLPSPAQDAGPRRLAGPFSYGSFIHTSQPVFTGAFPDPSYSECGCTSRRDAQGSASHASTFPAKHFSQLSSTSLDRFFVRLGWSAASGEIGNQFSGGEVASQLVAERGEGRSEEGAIRRGTGVCVTRQRWTAAAASESRWTAAQRSS